MTADFNAGSFNLAMRFLPAGGAPFDRTPIPDGQGTYHGFTGLAEPGRIDSILATRDFGSLEYGRDTRNDGGLYPSDHFPVWVRLRLRYASTRSSEPRI